MSDILRQTFSIPAAHPALPGHFPGHPVVPGVVLLDAVAAALQNGWQLKLTGLPQVKFLRPLRPDEAAELVLERGPPLRFRIVAGSEAIASGIAQAVP